MTTQLNDHPRRILEFLCRRIPETSPTPQFESRMTISGELRLSLEEYDNACTELLHHKLIFTDQPYSNEADHIAPTPAGREWVKLNSSN